MTPAFLILQLVAGDVGPVAPNTAIRWQVRPVSEQAEGYLLHVTKEDGTRAVYDLGATDAFRDYLELGETRTYRVSAYRGGQESELSDPVTVFRATDPAPHAVTLPYEGGTLTYCYKRSLTPRRRFFAFREGILCWSSSLDRDSWEVCWKPR